jgi:AcrR family transcriptional regulator
MSGSARLTRAAQQARTREALLQAAADVFIERGLQGASVEAITERAGFSRGAFYSNFSSKEELFAAVLQDRVYAAYRAMVEWQLTAEGPVPSARQSAEMLAQVQAHPDGRWLFRLWFELLLQAGRDERMRELAAEFWRGNRELTARVIERRAAEGGDARGLTPEQMATALIALDIGLAIQHYVDPETVPLDTYPAVFGALFDDLPHGRAPDGH